MAIDLTGQQWADLRQCREIEKAAKQSSLHDHARINTELRRLALKGEKDAAKALLGAWVKTCPDYDQDERFRSDDAKAELFYSRLEYYEDRLLGKRREFAIARARKAHSQSLVNPVTGYKPRSDARANILLVSDALHSLMAAKCDYRIIVTLRDISKITGKHQQQVSRALDHLSQLGWLEVTKPQTYGKYKGAMEGHIVASLIHVTDYEVDAVAWDDEILLPAVDLKFTARVDKQQKDRDDKLAKSSEKWWAAREDTAALPRLTRDDAASAFEPEPQKPSMAEVDRKISAECTAVKQRAAELGVSVLDPKFTTPEWRKENPSVWDQLRFGDNA